MLKTSAFAECMKKKINNKIKKQLTHGSTTSHHSNRSHLKQGVVALIVACLVVVVGVVSHCVVTKECGSLFGKVLFQDRGTVVTSKGKIYVTVVDTPRSREKGLSGKDGLKEKEGMLFVFDKPGRYGFWMKDMLFPIDIIWINDDGLVVHLERDVRPDSYPKAFINVLEASYVLEIAANQSEKLGLYMGAQVEIK